MKRTSQMKHYTRTALLVVFTSIAILSCRSADPSADISRTPELWSVLGKSAAGQPIYYYEHSPGGHGKSSSPGVVTEQESPGDDVVLVIGCTHGDEQVTGQVVIRLAEWIAQQKPDSLKSTILFVPILNPDGAAKGTRANAHGVDINRNFPTKNWSPVATKDRYPPGPSPASEPETQLVLELLSRYNPKLIVSIHAALHMINYDGPAKDIANRMATFNGYRVSDSIGYPTPGSLGTYAGVERSIPIITLELPAVGVDEAWQQNRDALLEALR
ncbi:MAG: M14 family murein peptide amidase A [Bacteroidota bacterium]